MDAACQLVIAIALIRRRLPLSEKIAHSWF